MEDGLEWKSTMISYGKNCGFCPKPTQDRISMAQCNDMVTKHDEVMMVPNSQMPMSESQYAASATKNITRLW